MAVIANATVEPNWYQKMNVTQQGKRLGYLGLTLGGFLLLSGNSPWHSPPLSPYTDSLLTEAQQRLPENALRGLSTAAGLKITVVATEPTVINPTNIDVDERGRIWVCEAYNYRNDINGNPSRPQGDRIVVLEDRDGDGRADTSTVFYQGPELNAPLGICVLGNRVLVSQSPYVWVFTDENDDGKADHKEILFQGIGGQQHDHGVHAFVFGPDGKLYFNLGNEGNTLLDGQGKPILDGEGDEITPAKYRQGMVLRCNPDGSEVEVLGHNFRNNFELALDSYGTIWQSDNDDDGNQSTRLNYVMPYGNYGYTDEMTGAGWQTSRTNLENDIPSRHWHLNDPGVVPNLLITGAGSPTGMLVYEGELLPAAFHSQLIHCDAGPNVVRAYPMTSEGAGYRAGLVNLIKGEKDQWFRPADVCAAPDGSLIIADWYDPGVGGHQAGDQQRGRIYRLAPPQTSYRVPTYDWKTPKGAVMALQNPNLSVRYRAWTALKEMGPRAVPELERLWQKGVNPRLRARALWVLAAIQGPGKSRKYLRQALTDRDPNLRITGLRVTNWLKTDLVPTLKKLTEDPDAQVRREVALALHHATFPEAPALWARLASQYDGKDRWYLEALGIGADRKWDACLEAYLKIHVDPLASESGRNIIWRARSPKAIPGLIRMAGDSSVALSQRLKYFRALDFNPGPTREAGLLSLLARQSPNQPEMDLLILHHLDRSTVAGSPIASRTLERVLDASVGTPAYLDLIARYEVRSQHERLLDLALAQPDQLLGRTAADLLLRLGGSARVRQVMAGSDVDRTSALLKALGGVGSTESLNLLEEIVLQQSQPITLRRQAAEMLGNSSGGEERALNLLRRKQAPTALVPSLVAGVSRSWRKAVRDEAASFLPAKTVTTGRILPPVGELLARKGDAKHGQTVFSRYCAVCHQVNGEGMDFGPKLSGIGQKLAREGQYMAILHPSAGISFGYEGWELLLKDGSTLRGILSSRTETDLVIKYPGGSIQSLKTSSIKSMKPLSDSMMPEGLQEAMSTQELVDLVEYLSTLKGG